MGSCSSVPIVAKEVKIQPVAVLEDPKPLEIRIPDKGGDYYGPYALNHTCYESWDEDSDDE